MKKLPALALAAGLLVAAAPAAEARIAITKIVSAPTVYPNLFDSSAKNDKLVAETIVLRNTGRRAKMLTGRAIRDRAGNRYRFGAVRLCAGCRIELHTGRGEDTRTDLYWNRSSEVWNNDRDKAFLVRRGVVKDTCAYPPKAEGGVAPPPPGFNGTISC